MRDWHRARWYNNARNSMLKSYDVLYSILSASLISIGSLLVSRIRIDIFGPMIVVTTMLSIYIVINQRTSIGPLSAAGRCILVVLFVAFYVAAFVALGVKL